MSFLFSRENDCLYHLAINPIPFGEERDVSLFYLSTSRLPDSVTTASQESALLTTTEESTADRVLKSTNWWGGAGHPARRYLRKRWPAAEGQCRCARLQTHGCPSSWWDAAETAGSHSSSAERP